MFEVLGPFARPTPGILPLLLALAPLFGVFAFGDPARARWRALGALGVGALGATVFFAWSLRWPGEQRMILAHLGVAARIGQLDLVLALALDPLGALASAAVALVAARLVWAQRKPRRIGLLCALASAMQLVVLADGAATLALAFGVASLLGAALGYVHSAHFVADRVGDVALVGAAGVLFWALGGAWIDGQYTPDLEPRVVVAATAPKAQPVPVDDDDDERPATPLARGARASLAFGGLPGAFVLFDGAWLRDARKKAVVAPFADVPISAGPHAVRFRPGAGADDYMIPRFDAAENEAALLVERGATTTFRTIQDDLVWREASPEAGAPPGRDALGRRRFFGGVSAASIVLALLALGLAARARVFPFAPSIDEPARALGALGAVVLCARFPLGFASPSGQAAVASALAVASLVSGAIALRSRRAGALLAAEIALAGAGAVAGAPALAVVHAAVACFLFAREKPASHVGLLALLPTRVAFAAACATLPLAPLVTAAVVAASWLASCAIARRATGRDAAGVLASVAAFAAAIDLRTFGAATAPLGIRGLAASFRAAPAPSAPSSAVFGLVALLVAFAWVAARTGALERFARAPALTLASAWAPFPARAARALAGAIAAALVELETRAAVLVRAGDSLLRAAGSLASIADEVAFVAPSKRLRFALPPERAVRFVLVPVALAAAALFAVPWVS